MGYRILVEPQAAEKLRTSSSYVVQGLGRQLAELADREADAAGLLRLVIDDVTAWYRIDIGEQTLTVVEVASAAEEQPGAQAG